MNQPCPGFNTGTHTSRASAVAAYDLVSVQCQLKRLQCDEDTCAGCMGQQFMVYRTAAGNQGHVLFQTLAAACTTPVTTDATDQDRHLLASTANLAWLSGCNYFFKAAFQYQAADAAGFTELAPLTTRVDHIFFVKLTHLARYLFQQVILDLDTKPSPQTPG